MKVFERKINEINDILSTTRFFNLFHILALSRLLFIVYFMQHFHIVGHAPKNNKYFDGKLA